MHCCWCFVWVVASSLRWFSSSRTFMSRSVHVTVRHGIRTGKKVRLRGSSEAFVSQIRE